MGGKRSGFTLIEALVALAILAVGLAAAARSATISAESAWRARAETYALWVAQNKMAECRVIRRAHRAMGAQEMVKILLIPDCKTLAGALEESGETVMGGITFYWKETLNEDGTFTVEVFHNNVSGHLLASLRGVTWTW